MNFNSSTDTNQEKKKTIRSLEDCPEVLNIVNLISAQNPLQKKRIHAFLKNQNEEYWDFAEDLSRILNHSFLTNEEERIQAARSYNKMCMDFLKEQIRFRKSGVYRINDASVAQQEVYSDLNVMRYYMVGLLLSYLFWPNHYELFRFFRENLPKKRISSYLEVGVGHGLFTSTILSQFPEVKATIIDISETSLRTAKEVLQTFQVDHSEINFILGDYVTTPIEESCFDFIIMGEVLEHVNDAPAFLQRTKSLLSPDGKIYLSTAANSPALDHVYHFHSADEIRDLLKSTGFKIISDLALASEDIPIERWEEELVTINYCALLKHEE
jgi:2-polyprenyl-3-methyl-5-hydroxy-6-metoxy-1,4-benzoquinol methylase